MRIIFDENLGPRFAEILSLCYKDTDATHVSRLGYRGFRDTRLLEELATHRPLPVLIGADVNITRRGDERKALKESRIHYILFKSNIFEMRFPEQIWRLLKLWPKIISFVTNKTEPVHVVVDLCSGETTPL